MNDENGDGESRKLAVQNEMSIKHATELVHEKNKSNKPTSVLI